MRSIRRNTDERIRSLERAATTGGDTEVMAYARELQRVGRGPSEDITQLLDSMGAEAWRAWVLDGEYEWRPGTVELGDAYAEYNEDSEEYPWSQGWSVPGLAVRRHADGSPMVVRTHWVVDRSGNWDATGDDEWPVGSPHAELDQAARYRDNRGSWVEYVGWVIANGRDPLDEFNVSERRGPRKTWRFELAQDRDRVVVTAARRFDGPRHGWVVVPLGTLQQQQIDWLSASERRIEAVRLGSGRSKNALVTNVENLDVIRQNVTGKDLSDSGRIVKDSGATLLLEVRFEGERQAATARAIRAAARRAQVDLGEQLVKAEQEVERLRALARRCAHCNAEIVSEDFKGKTVWVGSTGGDACEDSPTGSHVPDETIRLSGVVTPADGEGDADVVFCEACGEEPDEGQRASEHEPGCSSAGRIACALHHECDQRELIGWQITNLNRSENPEGMMSFEVYSRAFVDNWMASQTPTERARWQLLPIYEGDVEEPTIIGDDEVDLPDAFRVGMVVHIDTDNADWGRLACDAVVEAVHRTTLRVRTLDNNRTTVTVPKSDAFPREDTR